ncbi:MAG: hypothetical protein KAU48_11990, partial [Candidatus Thorarchaeota archaeon]|nr:hypothetical protein [Candidatus Thorarchaeota archaeon]
PTEVQEIVDSIAVNEEMYTLEPETSASAISTALCDKLDSESKEELDETEQKERLFQLLPAFVKEFFSTTWLDKLSCAEIEELLTIPEDDLKIVIQSLKDSRDAAVETEVEIEAEPEVGPEVEIEAELEVEPESDPEIEDEAKPKIATQDDFKVELIAELKTEIEGSPEIETEDEPEIKLEAESEIVVGESVIEYEDPRMTEFVEKYGEEKANILITIPESLLEGIPEDQIKEMDMELLEGLKQALESEDESEITSEDAPYNDLLAMLDIEYVADPEEEPKDDSEEDVKVETEDETKL